MSFYINSLLRKAVLTNKLIIHFDTSKEMLVINHVACMLRVIRVHKNRVTQLEDWQTHDQDLKLSPTGADPGFLDKGFKFTKRSSIC